MVDGSSPTLDCFAPTNAPGTTFNIVPEPTAASLIGLPVGGNA